jgi:hypothetical protein
MVRVLLFISLFQLVSLHSLDISTQHGQSWMPHRLEKAEQLAPEARAATASKEGNCVFRGRSMPAHVRAMFSGLAGGLAGSTVSFLLHPLDTLKTISQTAEGRAFPNVLSAGRSLILQKGVYAGLYAGARTVALGSFFSSALYFGTYESVKGYWSAAVPPSLKPMSSSLAAITGNAASSLLFVPKEVLKQRCQVRLSSAMYPRCSAITAQASHVLLFPFREHFEHLAASLVPHE